MWLELWNDVLVPALITIVTGTVTILVSVAISALRKWAEKLKVEWTQQVLAEVTSAAELAVAVVNQTFLDEVREIRGENGKLTAEEAKAAAQKALTIAKGQLGKDLLAALARIVGSEARAEYVILDMIEGAVNGTKS